jgi:hypothetical protein
MSADGLSGKKSLHDDQGRFKKKKPEKPISIVRAKEFLAYQGRIHPDDVRTTVHICRGEQGFVHADKGDFKIVEFPYGTGFAILEVESNKLIPA